MISTEARNSKPYALLVQCVPYHSLNTKQVRDLVTGFIKEMESRGMSVTGNNITVVLE